LIFLVIFTTLVGNDEVRIGSLVVTDTTYFVAAMASYGVIQACYTYIVASITAQREAGVLKRIDGSPLPTISFMCSRVLHSVTVSVILVALTATFGRAFYGTRIPTGLLLLDFLVMLGVGAASFCALGLAVSTVIPNSDATTPVLMCTVLPLCFLSGIFSTFGNNTPSWLIWIGRIFPIRHFASGMMAGFVGTPFDWTDVLIVAAWGFAGLLLAIPFFTWEPHTK
jgi:ABC-2 type transport system permease protein